MAVALASQSARAQSAQNGSAPSPPPPTILSTRSTLILVPALVRNKAGALVFTLQAGDFSLTDNGVEQKLSLEEDIGDQPLALVIAVETGGAGGRQLDIYRTLPSMIDTIVGGIDHRVAVVSFDSEPSLVQDFTDDMNLAGEAFHNLGPGNEKAAILDGIAFSVDLLRKQPPQYRRAILLLSETVDHGSHTRIAEALRAIGDTNTAIYSVAFSSSKADTKEELSKLNSDKPGPPGGCMAKDPDADPNITENQLAKAFECLSLLAPPLRAAKIAVLLSINGLRHNVPETVAHLTGGEYFKFGNTKSLEKDLQTISNHVPNRYMLSFNPQNPQPGVHALDLRLKDYPDLKVTARSSYWAEPDAANSSKP
jgi:VWFA-related protein